MNQEKDIYLIRDRTPQRYQIVLTSAQHRHLTVLSKALHRSISDLVREGVSIVLDGYADILKEALNAERQKLD